MNITDPACSPALWVVLMALRGSSARQWAAGKKCPVKGSPHVSFAAEASNLGDRASSHARLEVGAARDGAAAQPQPTEDVARGCKEKLGGGLVKEMISSHSVLCVFMS